MQIHFGISLTHWKRSPGALSHFSQVVFWMRLRAPNNSIRLLSVHSYLSITLGQINRPNRGVRSAQVGFMINMTYRGAAGEKKTGKINCVDVWVENFQFLELILIIMCFEIFSSSIASKKRWKSDTFARLAPCIFIRPIGKRRYGRTRKLELFVIG